jgi:predicted NAD-dependent protein-ADP-ribosyltransferase YbiA (DUF1768 family)
MQGNDDRSLISAEMYFMRRAVGYSLSDCKRNEEVILYTDSTHKKIYRTVNKNSKNGWDSKKDCAILIKKKQKFEKTSKIKK